MSTSAGSDTPRLPAQWLLTWAGIVGVAIGVAALVPLSPRERAGAFACAALTLVALAHSVLGERFILQRLFRRTALPATFGSPRLTAQILRFAWHLTTIAWLGAAALALQLTGGASPAVGLRTLAATFAASAVLSLLVSRGRHLVWVVFALVSAALTAAS